MASLDSGYIYIYVIDRDDLIVSLSDNWLAFAQANQAAETCYPDRVLGKPIWDFISGIESKSLFRKIIDNIRETSRPVTLPFRCDSPDKRRYLELTITPVNREHIEFASHIIREEPRDIVELLNHCILRSSDMITMCSICKKIALSKNVWAEVDDAVIALRLFEKDQMPSITHGLCNECYHKWMRELDNP